MKHFYSILTALILISGGLKAQFTVTINVTDADSGLPLENAQVVLDGNFFGTTDASGSAVFTDFADGEYSYSVTLPCYSEAADNVEVIGADAQTTITLDPSTTNSVFFFVGSPLTIPGASVVVTGDDFFQEITTGALLGDIIENVPFGEYSYTITAACYEMVSGNFTVDCNNGDGIAVFVEPATATSNSVFFFIGSPLSISGAVVEVSGDGFSQELVTGAPFGDVIENVLYGDYSYIITANCYETVSGTFTVDCANGDGIAVFEEPTEIVINNTVAQSGATLEAEASGSYFYQWVDCDNSNEPVSGATNQSFTATTNGSYAVVISNQNCAVTSECYSVTGVGINTLYAENKLSVYPNPFSTVVSLELPDAAEVSKLEVYSLAGQLVHS
ncbi:MAG: hypothetical protein WED33_13025 [Bacteroidia bacterium]